MADKKSHNSDNKPSSLGRHRKKDNKYKQNYIALILFVAGGVQNAGKNRKEIKTEEKKNKESYSFEDNISAFRFKR